MIMIERRFPGLLSDDLAISIVFYRDPPFSEISR